MANSMSAEEIAVRIIQSNPETKWGSANVENLRFRAIIAGITGTDIQAINHDCVAQFNRMLAEKLGLPVTKIQLDSTVHLDE